jgi:peptidoglycan hydrolase CwlO-like protein
MGDVDVLIERLKSQIAEMDYKVASLFCEIESIDDQKKHDCLKKVNELQKNISDAQNKIEELSNKIKETDIPFFKPGF